MNTEFYFYLNGRYVKGKSLKLSPFDRAFLFGDGVYETLRWYKGKLFEPALHIERLKRSLQSSRINFKLYDEIEKIINNLIKKNKFEDEEHLFIYLQVTRGDYFPRQHHFPPEEVEPTFFISVQPFKRHEKELEHGIKIILEEDTRWKRCDIKSTMLMPNVLARQKALEQNAVEAVFVNNGFITEGTHTSFCAAKNGKLYTPPLTPEDNVRTNNILDGITRRIILEICKKEEIPCTESEIKTDDLKSFDEMMVLGTISEVTPVIQFDNFIVGEGKPGPVTLELQYLLGERIFV